MFGRSKAVLSCLVAGELHMCLLACLLACCPALPFAFAFFSFLLQRIEVKEACFSCYLFIVVMSLLFLLLLLLLLLLCRGLLSSCIERERETL